MGHDSATPFCVYTSPNEGKLSKNSQTTTTKPIETRSHISIDRQVNGEASLYLYKGYYLALRSMKSLIYRYKVNMKDNLKINKFLKTVVEHMGIPND